MFKSVRKDPDRSQLRESLLKDIPPIGERFKHSQVSKAGDVKEKMQNAKDLLMQVQKVRGESAKKTLSSANLKEGRSDSFSQKPTTTTTTTTQPPKTQDFSDDDEIIDL